jgi:hypothetical protein
MNGADAAYHFDRYHRLLVEADDESKRLALISLLIEEKAKDRLATRLIRSGQSGSGNAETSYQGRSSRGTSG